MSLLYYFCVGAFPTSIIIIVMFLLMGTDITVMAIWGIITGVGLLIGKNLTSRRSRAAEAQAYDKYPKID